MFAISKQKPGKGLQVVDISPPALGPNEVRIKVLYAGICGTDMHIYQWDAWAQNRIKPPLILGHEFSGQVVDVGANVTQYEKGQLVSAECHVVCGVCSFCRTGQAHLCLKTEIIGVDRRGAFSEEVVVPQENLWPIPEKICPQSAAIFDPLGNAMHTVTTHSVAGQHVLIMGAGAIGLAAICMAKTYGARQVSVVEPNVQKHTLAKELGADDIFLPTADLLKEFGKNRPTVLLEMSGHPDGLISGLQALLPGGRAALLGIPSAPFLLDIAQLVVFKGLTLTGVTGRKMFETWLQVQSFVYANPHVPAALITQVLPAENFQKGFDALEAGASIKTILAFNP